MLYFYFVVGVSVLCLFYMIPWVGLQSVIVAFPGHTHLYFYTYFSALSIKNSCSSFSRLVAISLSRVVNLFCHSVQCDKMEYFKGEQSSRTNWMLRIVSCDCTLLATSVYLQRKIRNT